ncbi:MAG: DinB family protein [Bacilli bacterium]
MSETSAVRELLLAELALAVRTTGALLEKATPELWDFRPREEMRTVLELANHLTQSPLIDLAILKEQSQEEVHALEQALTASDAAHMRANMENGLAELSAYMGGLSEHDFLHKESKPFYGENGSTQAKWLVEIVTHAFHHRGQLFTYLKQAGLAITMFDLY